MNTSQGLDDNPPCDLFGSKGIVEEKKGLINMSVVMNRVQIIEAEGFNWREPVDSDYDSEDSNNEPSHFPF
jgi:hypothetical protein